MYSFGEIRRQAYLLQKKLNLLPERNKIVDAQEDDMGRVLTELEREVIEAWMENSWAYQEDFRLDAPPDFTVWQRQPDGTFVAAGVAAEKNNNEKYEAYEHASRKYEPTVQKNESKIVKFLPCLAPLFSRIIEQKTFVEMSRMRLEDFPDEVIEGGHMLKEVSLASNLLTFVPNDAFETLTRLTTLDMNDNMLGSLPEQLGLLTDLTRLTLRRNQLKEMPRDIRKLAKLRHLDITDNMIAEIPALWGQMVNLRELKARNNMISFVANNLVDCHIEYFDLSANAMDELPEAHYRLGGTIKALLLHENNLTFLPWDMRHFAHLSKLTLSKNRLQFLPEDIGGLQNMGVFDCQFNNLRRVPKSIGKILNLTEILVNNNALDKLPETVCQCALLRRLHCHSNRLAALPSNINKLTMLTELTAQCNKIKELPVSGLGRLVNLHTLYLNSNMLPMGSVTEDSDLDLLTGLTELDLDDNPIGDAQLLHPTVRGIFARLNRPLPVSSQDRMAAQGEDAADDGDDLLDDEAALTASADVAHVTAEDSFYAPSTVPGSPEADPEMYSPLKAKLTMQRVEEMSSFGSHRPHDVSDEATYEDGLSRFSAGTRGRMSMMQPSSREINSPDVTLTPGADDSKHEAERRTWVEQDVDDRASPSRSVSQRNVLPPLMDEGGKWLGDDRGGGDVLEPRRPRRRELRIDYTKKNTRPKKGPMVLSPAEKHSQAHRGWQPTEEQKRAAYLRAKQEKEAEKMGKKKAKNSGGSTYITTICSPDNTLKVIE